MPAVVEASKTAAPPDLAVPGVWRGDELGAMTLETVSTGFDPLDIELPGAGWPKGTLTDILQAQPGLHEWRLLLPIMRRTTVKAPAVLIGCPHLPNLPALASLGVPAASLLIVEASKPAERLWAAEQALRCRDIGVLLAWLPQARQDQLRRLQVASQSGSMPLVFVFRPAAAEHESSPAPLRLHLRGLGRRGLEMRVVKRRGPALDTPVRIPAPFPAVAALKSDIAIVFPEARDRAVDRARSRPIQAGHVPA